MRDDYPLYPDGHYHYVLTHWACLTFLILFATSTAAHLVQAVYFRLWWLIPTAVFAGIGELLGWTGRFIGSDDPTLDTPFLMQISTLIFSPTFLLACIFIIFGRLIRIMGPQYCRLTFKQYAWVFLTCDTVALVVQAVGGSMAAAADDSESAMPGARTMLGGIVIQLVVIVLFLALSGEFLVRYYRDQPIRTDGEQVIRPNRLDTRTKLQIVGLSTMMLAFLIRTVYRTIELQGGWTSEIITNQTLFNVLDGIPIILAMMTANVFHPGLLIYNKGRELPPLLLQRVESDTIQEVKPLTPRV